MFRDIFIIVFVFLSFGFGWRFLCEDRLEVRMRDGGVCKFIGFLRFSIKVLLLVFKYIVNN